MVKAHWLVLAALLPCIALASPTVEPKKDGPAAKSEEQDVVCTRQKSLGSNMSKKVCTTAAQRQAAREKAQKDVQQLGSCASNDPGTCIGEF